ncbi:hypothetical protein FPCIR_11985 [Fusarium pseudocircinatum]|uniref:Fucose-specific lectin n=1 Tax=Fusarium pseudocircinatum TaxID=56676 RepID=A0A8H5NTJ7_9HYPO|nr:hypothetical protein FPCIR_11985 [Fusarium pseudocircinatum]
MAEELHLPSDQVQEVPRSSMTIETTLSDGTTINLAVSPASVESSAVTASTTFTHTSFSFHITTSLPNHALPPRNSSPSPEPLSSPISLASEVTSKFTSSQLPPVTHLKPSKMAVTLPNDVVAVDTTERSLLFYVYPNSDQNNILSYLQSPDDEGTGEFTRHRIQVVRNPFKGDQEENIYVSPNNKQVAAITWKGSEGTEVRVYYVAKGTENIREVCKTGNGAWYMGSLSAKGNLFKIRGDTSISASVHNDRETGKYDIRVFAAEEGKINDKGLPQISVFQYVRIGNAKKAPIWTNSYITEAIEIY